MFTVLINAKNTAEAHENVIILQVFGNKPKYWTH